MTLRQREWIAFGVFFLLALTVALNFKRVEVSGHSMETAYQPGDVLLVWKTAPRDRLTPGDVIVFREADGEELIKRIFFIVPPGGAQEWPPPGFPAVISTPEGRSLPPYAPPGLTFRGYFDAVSEGRLPPPPPQNTIYVLGDNLLNSRDSRDFGPIAPSAILGKVIQWGGH